LEKAKNKQLSSKKVWEVLMKIEGIHTISVPSVQNLPPKLFQTLQTQTLYSSQGTPC
jgi:hypothetical protein